MIQFFLRFWPQFDIRWSSGHKINELQVLWDHKERLGFYCSCTSLPAKGKFIQFRQSWALNSYRKQVSMRNFTSVLGTFVAGRSELLLLLVKIFKDWFFTVARCSFYIILTVSYLLYMDNFSFFGRSYNDFHTCEVFLFWGLGANFNTIFFFNHLFRVISPDNLSPNQKTLFLLTDFLGLALCDVNPREYFSQTVCHDKTRTCSTWVVLTDKHFHPYS